MSAESFVVQPPTGATRLFVVVGNPIEQGMAPSPMNHLFADRDVDTVLVAAQAEPATVAADFEGLKGIGNLDGTLVSAPHKAVACAHADRLSERANLNQSGNAFRGEAGGYWRADNFVGSGFVAGPLNAGFAIADQKISLVGVGGGGVSIATALVLEGAASLTLADGDTTRMTSLAERLAHRWPGPIRTSSAPTPADSMINATPMRLRPEDSLPFEADHLPPPQPRGLTSS